MKRAWTSHLCQIVHKAAPHVLNIQYQDTLHDKEMLVLQGEISVIDAEASVLEIKKTGDELQPSRSSVSTAKVQDLKNLHMRACEGYIRSMHLGLKVGESWLVLNTAIYVWNHFLPFSRTFRYRELIPVFNEVVTNLLKMKQDDMDIPFLFQMVETYACAREHKFLCEQFQQRESSTTNYKSLLNLVATSDLVNANTNEDLIKAMELCECALSFNDDLGGNSKKTRKLMATIARIQGYMGLPVKTKEGDDDMSRAVALIETLRSSAGGTDAKNEAITQAMNALHSVNTFDPELWAKLARESLSLKEFSRAIECASEAIAMLDGGSVDEGGISMSSSYWLGVAEDVYGKCILALVKSSSDCQETEETLKLQAISHFVQSAKYGALSGRLDIINNAAREFWIASETFQSSVVTRSALLHHVEELLTTFQTVESNIDPKAPAYVHPQDVTAIRSTLYISLVRILYDQEKFREGLMHCRTALKLANEKNQQELWQWRIKFVLRSGQDLNKEMSLMKDCGDERRQAKLWILLAQMIPSKYDQQAAYQKAIDLVKDHPRDGVQYLLEYGEWLLLSGYGAGDAKLAFLSAADLLQEDRDGIGQVSSNVKSALLGSAGTARFRDEDSEIFSISSRKLSEA